MAAQATEQVLADTDHLGVLESREADYLSKCTGVGDYKGYV